MKGETSMNETLKWFQGLEYTKEDEDDYIYESSSDELNKAN